MSLCVLSGCSIFSDGLSDQAQERTEVPTESLSDVYFEPLPLDHSPLQQPDTKTLRDRYQALLEIVGDPKTREVAAYRLADLEGLVAEAQLEEGAATETAKSDGSQAKSQLFGRTIERYESLLISNPTHANSAEVLYQLAKAYEQQGLTEKCYGALERLVTQFPDSPNVAEVYFRMGEMQFNQGKYLSAIENYEQVIAQGDQNPYYATAAYMLGWSYFKDEQQLEALTAFSRLLDQSLPNEVIAESMLSQVDSRAQIERLSVGKKRLVNDTIRIMSLLFSYQDSLFTEPAASIQAHFEKLGPRHYEYVLYDALAQHYLNNDRYRDSAKAYKAFSDRHALHFQAPIFAVKQVDAYILGKFPTLVLPAKEEFVMRYGMAGEYWTNWPLVLQEQVAPYLNQYLRELAQFEHSRAQLLDKASRDSKGDYLAAKVQELKQQSVAAYLKAATWYRQFIDTFPQDELAPEFLFRLGESYFAAEYYEDALEVFEAYAYKPSYGVDLSSKAYPKASEAAYLALLSYREFMDNAESLKIELDANWLERQLASQMNFVTKFPDDLRALDVLHTNIQQLFLLKRYENAITNAQLLLGWQPPASADKLLASHLVMAHSHFELLQYPAAEVEYQTILELLSLQDLRRFDIQDKLAASIYKQGEANLSRNNLPLAVNDFLRVIAKTPNSAIRLNAQYDAASYLLELEEWQQAIGLLEDFRARFPNHELTKNIPDQLILAYQQNENWQQAAEELLALHQSNPESEEGRQALYVAAGYFYKIDNRTQALNAYRTYAHSYPLPFAEANEARFIMSEFYLKSNEATKRRFWLNKLILADRQAQQQANMQRSDRSRYLAAMASNVFAQDKLYNYKAIKLTQPLKDSLTKKKAALTDALEAYNQTLSYKIAEFSTIANFGIADIYHQLAKDLMASSRPDNLNALELEQYEILLEEQAYPFEEKAIEIHETNAKRSWNGVYDDWVQQSFKALQVLLPGRYNKVEELSEVTNEIY
ncbi:tetratricopeptide repeat protein [Paraglaciecola sp. 2405UD69-4]|uniref:tetratricopeptide repeat protein n=1 Tax=Paraglaciecola sp. 2405UD69-4 TaxID=3391836 RepID=UPI0039C932C9